MWKYIRKSDKKSFAVKKINLYSLNDQGKVLLKEEIKLLQNLSHPFIIKFIEKFEDTTNNKIYLVMELVEEGDL